MSTTRTASKPSLAKADYELLAEFRRALRVFLSFSEHAARTHGLQPQQYQALLSIAGFPGRDTISIGELAGHLLIAHHSAVGLVDRLQALKLVRRATDAADRRRVMISLMPKGRVILDKLYRVHRAELGTAGPRLARLLRKAAQEIPESSG